MKRKQITIAIDGPAGSGKSTIAKEIAKAIGLIYIDTGAMYRAVTLKAIEEEIPFANESALTELAKKVSLEFKRMSDGGLHLFMDGRDVSDGIRTQEVSRGVSAVSAVEGVRKIMVKRQQQLGTEGNVVMDGRDIGAKVLPQADLKIYLTASIKERANRRWRELTKKGVSVTREEIEESLKQRDEMDSKRKIDPLMPAPDSITIDTTDLGIEEVAQEILRMARRKINVL